VTAIVHGQGERGFERVRDALFEIEGRCVDVLPQPAIPRVRNCGGTMAERPLGPNARAFGRFGA
jgi:hypothetical protein